MKSKILFVVSILFGLIFVNSGLNKFFNYMPMPDDLPAETIELMTRMMEFGWLMPLVATVEIVAGILIMIPKYRPLAAVMIFPVMSGIVLTHIVNVPEGLPIALVLFGVNIWILVENRDRYAHMIA